MELKKSNVNKFINNLINKNVENMGQYFKTISNQLQRIKENPIGSMNQFYVNHV